MIYYLKKKIIIYLLFIQPCFAIEFDTWPNSDRGDPIFSFQVDHISFNYFNGTDLQQTLDANNPLPGNFDYPNPNQPPFVSAKKCEPLNATNNIEDGEDHCIKIIWEPNPTNPVQGKGRITVLFDGDFRNSIDINLINSLGDENGEVFWGYTSGNDAGQNEHKVCFQDFSKCKIWVRPDIEICEGDAIELSTTAIGYDLDNAQYKWTPAIGLNNPNAKSPIAMPRITTEYKVKMTTSDNCTSEATVNVTVNSRPSTAIVKEYGRCFLNNGNQVNVKDMVYGTKKMADCNFLLSCQSAYPDVNNGDYLYELQPFLIKIGPDGTREWQKLYIYQNLISGMHYGCARYTTNAYEVNNNFTGYNTSCDNTLNSSLFPDILKHVGYAVICEADYPRNILFPDQINREMLIFTINPDGTVRNKISYNETELGCRGRHIESTKDGGFIALGDVFGLQSILLVKLQSNLTPEFDLARIIYPGKWVEPIKVIECSDGSGYIVIGDFGEYQNNIAVNQNIFAIKVIKVLHPSNPQDFLFRVDWGYRYNLPTDIEKATSIHESYNSEGQLVYFITGYGWDDIQNSNKDGFLLNISNTGELNFAKKIGTANSKEECWSIVENSLDEFGILLNTNINSQNPSNLDIALIKIPKLSLEAFTGVVQSQQIYGDENIPEQAFFLTTVGFNDFATASQTYWGTNNSSNIRFITSNSFQSYCAESSDIVIKNEENVITSILDKPTYSWLNPLNNRNITVVDAEVSEESICEETACACSDIAWFGQDAFNIKYTINQINSHLDKCCFDIRLEQGQGSMPPNYPFHKLDILITTSGIKINNEPLENFEGQGY